MYCVIVIGVPHYSLSSASVRSKGGRNDFLGMPNRGRKLNTSKLWKIFLDYTEKMCKILSENMSQKSVELYLQLKWNKKPSKEHRHS